MRLRIAFLLLAITACTTADEEDGIDDAAGGKADGYGLTGGEARGVLRVANEVARDELVDRATLASRAADGIVTHRESDRFDSLEELDAVPWVGPIAFEKLVAYARELGWVTEDETLLVGDESGHIAVLHLGATVTRADVSVSGSGLPTSVRSHADQFHIVYDTGRLVTIDPDAGRVVQTLALPGAATDVEWLEDGSLYVTLTEDAAVAHVAADGAELARIDLASLATTGGAIQPRRMTRVDDHVFVQVARTGSDGRETGGAVAVIDTATHAVARVVELTGEDGGQTIVGTSPDFAMAYDARRDRVLVSAAGVRPVTTGGFFRIDATSLALHDVTAAHSGFQGVAVIGPPFDTLFMIYHTSTPTTSSHLFAYDVAADGTLTSPNTGTLVDAFDGIDALAINSAGTLVAMANTCVTGFCIGGAGVNLVDARTRAIQPKVKKDVIGFEPGFVVFR